MFAAIDNSEHIIHAGNFQDYLAPHEPNAQGNHGLKPRDYNTHPVGCYSWAPALAVDFPLIPRSEWDARLADMDAQQSKLSDIRLQGGPGGGPMPSRDQNGKGYCWAHSGVSAHLLVRALMHQPYADLSAYSVACIIKSYADEGGWGAEGVDFQVKNGVATSATWAQQSMSRSNDNANTRQDMSQHKIVAQWADLNAQQYDRTLTFDQVGTLLLSRDPCVTDFNWWSHSVCGADLVSGSGMRSRTRVASGKLSTLAEFEAIWAMNNPVTAGYGLRIWNSWGDSWSQQGMGVLTGNQAVPDGCIAVRTVAA